MYYSQNAAGGGGSGDETETAAHEGGDNTPLGPTGREVKIAKKMNKKHEFNWIQWSWLFAKLL